ncbi:hypothetical protein FEM48_Zijuj10G0082300 [Ziziphus jujuba var. spinosa]|uniref:Uncharacterized protein n=1 Tax=Ziziphus jujuba var. spinosa TaxID=714518 RepID=A0A978UM94_ZIZJJ|nr:hypothetical protein FEM48_Zijuj10G0082300 [Ziziphus jujuba var. spinosa]
MEGENDPILFLWKLIACATICGYAMSLPLVLMTYEVTPIELIRSCDNFAGRCGNTVNSICTFKRRVAELNTSFHGGYAVFVHRVTSSTMYGHEPPYKNLSGHRTCSFWAQRKNPDICVHVRLKLKGKQCFVLLTALIILPTTWLRSLGLLAYVSAGGVLASVIVVGCVLWVGVIDDVGFHEGGITCLLYYNHYQLCINGHNRLLDVRRIFEISSDIEPSFKEN